MTVSSSLFTGLVSLALLVTVLAPVLLIVLFIRDSRKGDLW